MFNKIFTIKLIILISFLSLNCNTALATWPGQRVLVNDNLMIGDDLNWIAYLSWGVVFGVLLYAIYWVLNLPPREKQFFDSKNDAISILSERFAKGEISRTEYQIKKQIIMD